MLLLMITILLNYGAVPAAAEPSAVSILVQMVSMDALMVGPNAIIAIAMTARINEYSTTLCPSSSLINLFSNVIKISPFNDPGY